MIGTSIVAAIVAMFLSVWLVRTRRRLEMWKRFDAKLEAIQHEQEAMADEIKAVIIYLDDYR